MTPIESHKFLSTNKISLTELMLLEVISKHDAVLTGTVVDVAVIEYGFSSQATVFKYLAKMKRRRLVLNVQIRGQDQRCSYIRANESGRNILLNWCLQPKPQANTKPSTSEGLQ